MATTPNYGWVTPAPTDFVTDLPADFETFADAVDASVKALNPETTLGDISYRSSTADTNTRLGIGTTGQVLTVSGGVPAWSTLPAAGGMTLIAATATDGVTNVDFTSIPGTYKHLLLVWDQLRSATAGSGQLEIKVNNTTGSPYFVGRVRVSGTTVTGATAASSTLNDNIDMPTSTQDEMSGVLWIYDYASTTRRKVFTIENFGYSDNNSALQYNSGVGYWDSASAITSVKAARNVAANFANGGQFRLYGVS